MQATIIEVNGGFSLLGSDGYSTSEQVYPTRAEAESAACADKAAEDSGFSTHSPVTWVY